MPSAILASERRSGLANETVVVAAIITPSIVAVIVGVAVISERGGRNCTRGADRAADHAGCYFAGPEPIVMVIDVMVIDSCGVLLLTDDLVPRYGILRQCRRCDHRGQNCGRGEGLQVHSLSPL